MSFRASLHSTIAELLKEHSVEEITKEIKTQSPKSSKVLTIICNAGLHAIPEHFLRGEVFNFSEGSFDVGEKQIEELLFRSTSALAECLRKTKWTRIYVVPTGHPLLISVVTLAVFRVTRIDPVMVSYFGVDGYLDVDLKMREWLSPKETLVRL